MEYTAILLSLSEDRKHSDEALACTARAEYGTAFEEKFSYRKGGVTRVLTKPADIAKKYWSLKGSNNESDSD